MTESSKGGAVTYEAMDKAYDELTAAGKDITMAALRERIGGGSMRDIHRHYKPLLEAKRGPVPTVRDERIRQILTALELSVSDRTKDVQANYDEDRKRFDADLEGVVAANSKLEAEKAAAEDEIARLKKMLGEETIRAASAERALQAAQAEVADAHAKLATAQASADQLAAVVSERDSARAERDNFAGRLEMMRNENATINEVAVLRTENESMRAELAKLKAAEPKTKAAKAAEPKTKAAKAAEPKGGKKS